MKTSQNFTVMYYLCFLLLQTPNSLLFSPIYTYFIYFRTFKYHEKQKLGIKKKDTRTIQNCRFKPENLQIALYKRVINNNEKYSY